MSEFASTLSSPMWWFSVVLVGVAVNLVSAYLKPLLDRKMAGYSSARKERLESFRNERDARLEKMRSSDRALFLAARREHGWWLWAIFLFALSAVILITGNVMTFIFAIAIANLLALVLMLLGMHSVRRAISIGTEIDDATQEG